MSECGLDVENDSMINWHEAIKAKFDEKDIPCVLFADELMAAYPSAKIVLTNRDVDAWIPSVERCFYAILSWKRWYLLQLLDKVQNPSQRSLLSHILNTDAILFHRRCLSCFNVIVAVEIRNQHEETIVKEFVGVVASENTAAGTKELAVHFWFVRLIDPLELFGGVKDGSHAEIFPFCCVWLALHHKVAPMEFNREVDDALPLDDILTPNRQLRQLLADIDTSQVKLWLFTNGYITHALRVVRLLGIDDLFEGITYCDYSKIPIRSKPHPEMFEKAEMEAGASPTAGCFFVDDSYLNCHDAQQRGWTAAHLVEDAETGPDVKAAQYQIKDLEELRGIFPQFFKTSNTGSAITHPGLALNPKVYQETESHIPPEYRLPSIAGVS
ncbi:MAG: hypothetical protein Q9195_009233 [Heterodermia aff. obscurata]